MKSNMKKASPSTKVSGHSHTKHEHDHREAQKRLNRVKGQVEAISRMLEEKKYCMDIVQQVRAASSALKGVEQEILKNHLEVCVRQAMESKDAFEIHNKIDEIIKVWK